MIRVSELVEQLKQYPADAVCYAYEGEITGVVIRDKEDKEQLGYITTEED